MSGGSVYLLSIAEFLRKSGYRVAFIGVSPDGIGIRPYTQIDREVLRTFDLYRIQGWCSIGRYWLRVDSLLPWVVAPLKLALRKCRPISQRLLPASITARLHGYSQRVRDLSPASAAEVAFARRFLQILSPDHIFVYYFCLTNILETPEAVGRHSYVLTHSLFSERSRHYAGNDETGIRSKWSPVCEDVEMGGLAKASTIVSIQEAETRTIRRCLPSHHVVTAPPAMSIRRGKKRQLSSRCLFVGAASDHNALGLAWFVKSVWPTICRIHRDATLRVCGDISRRIALRAPGLELVGQVSDLTEEYAEATLCLIPLIEGGGLKIKLVEAFCHGRTGVTTSVGAQGLEDDIHRLMAVSDDADSFAAEVIDLIDNRERRKAMEAQVLCYAAKHFSPEACYSSLLAKTEPRISSAG
jgi:glycosyltransferase involved in cell wall biosynthesis